MRLSPLVLVDHHRGEQFQLIGGTRNPFRIAQQREDHDGVLWKIVRVAGHWFAANSIGPSSLYHPLKRDELARKLTHLRETDLSVRSTELQRSVSNIRWGPAAERVLWAVHSAVLTQNSSVVWIPDQWLRGMVWGEGIGFPRHWLGELRDILTGLSFLHSAVAGERHPAFGPSTTLLAHSGYLDQHAEQDQCPADCPMWGARPHRHFQVVIGPGFLGILEQMGCDADGITQYTFKPRGPGREGPTLRSLGKSGSLVPAFLPAKLGDPAQCRQLNQRHHRLLQALLRETTRSPDRRRSDPSSPHVIVGDRVPGFSGRVEERCRLLATNGRYVTFGGNKRRRGLGYRLMTPGGWLAKCGLPNDQPDLFLGALEEVSQPLDLVVVGIGRSPDEWLDLQQLRALSHSAVGRQLLDRLHVRVYTPADYLTRWSAYFGWSAPERVSKLISAQEPRELKHLMQRKRIPQADAAGRLGVDPSQLSRMLSGKRPFPNPLLMRLREYVTSWESDAGQTVRQAAVQSVVGECDGTSMLKEAERYLERRWSVIPLAAGRKKALVKWKPFQKRLPTREEICRWWTDFPDAGIALVLGPVSDVFAVDVDGPEAYQVLIKRLGQEPVAPKVMSGKGGPHRFHLYFRCPPVPTKAKATPWHKNLEFRGRGGILVLPPSLHVSGNRYAWATGRSIDDLPLPPLPAEIVDAIKPRSRGKAADPPPVPTTAKACAPSTADFLAGRYADGPHWNARLFKAACDLHGRGIAIDKAMPMLIAGARPWDDAQHEMAVRTIQSAYAQPRTPSQG